MAIKEHQVVKGETVSGIAQKFGVPVSSVSGFKSGDPNQIGIGETLNINIPDVQAQTMEIQRGVKDDPTAMPSFEVDVPDTFDTDTVTKITKEPTTAEDITAKIRASEEARAQIQADIEAASELTPEEEALRRQVVDLRAAGRTAEEEALRSGETLRFAAGEAQRVRREANLSILAASERLQALTGIRESRFEKLKTKLGFEDTRFERLLGLEQEFKAMKKEEKEEMRDNLSVILDFSAGLTFEQLDPESQQQIADSAESIGIPLESIKNALRNNAIAQREKEEKSTPIKLSSSQRTKLAGAGFPIDQIDSIEQSINENGVKATLMGVDDPTQRTAVAEILNAFEIEGEIIEAESITQRTVDELETDIIDSATNEQIKKLKTLADEAGVSSMWNWKTTDIKNFFNTPEMQAVLENANKQGLTTEEVINALIS